MHHLFKFVHILLCKSKRLDLDPDPHQSEKTDPDPDPYQSDPHQ
jgi:hypothetical protein